MCDTCNFLALRVDANHLINNKSEASSYRQILVKGEGAAYYPGILFPLSRIGAKIRASPNSIPNDFGVVMTYSGITRTPGWQAREGSGGARKWEEYEKNSNFTKQTAFIYLLPTGSESFVLP